jgi:hypothetical protein
MQNRLNIAFERSIRERAIKVALVVGTLLVIINHGDALLSGEVTIKAYIQMGLTYLVPYGVSTYASVQAIYHQETGRDT